jgi:hypothetical protein
VPAACTRQSGKYRYGAAYIGSRTKPKAMLSSVPCATCMHATAPSMTAANIQIMPEQSSEGQVAHLSLARIMKDSAMLR